MNFLLHDNFKTTCIYLLYKKPKILIKLTIMHSNYFNYKNNNEIFYSFYENNILCIIDCLNDYKLAIIKNGYILI